MIHLYYGNGKGKTTAAMGLALRMAGHNGGVVVAQFFKSSHSGERKALAYLPQVTLVSLPPQVKFTFQLSPEEARAASIHNQALLQQALALAQEPTCSLLILDEVCSAVSLGLVPLSSLLELLDLVKAETVLTGRDPAPELYQRADYITHFQKIRHPYDTGVSARPGIEF